jgi:hypothetical protein
MPELIQDFDYSYGTCESGQCKEIQCVNIQNNGNASNKLDVLFIGEDYNLTAMPTYVNDVSAFSSSLLSYEPFNSSKNKINIRRIDNIRDLGCYYNCAGIERLICCDNTATQRVAVACPYDEIIVIVNNNTYGGSGGWMAVSYRGMATVAVHEFGHSFGGLPDHYNTDPSCASYHCMMCSLSYNFGSPPPSDDNCLQTQTTLMGGYQ